MSAEGTMSFSEPEYAKSDKNKADYPWYLSSIEKYLIPQTQLLLKQYSKIPPEEQSEHVHRIRDQAWAIRSYPCTGLGVWLVPFISRSPAYPTILHRLRDGARMIDIGCFLGSDLRCLAFDGAPTANMYGVDIVSHWETGFALYRDQDFFEAHFIETDMLSENHPDLEALQGTSDIVSISAVLHQWDWGNQIVGAKRVAAFTRPGALVIGYQIGNIDGKAVMNKSLQLSQWRHDPDSFSKLWKQVGVETGTEWKTEARLVDWESLGWDPEDTNWLEPGDKVLDFVVTRIS